MRNLLGHRYRRLRWDIADVIVEVQGERATDRALATIKALANDRREWQSLPFDGNTWPQFLDCTVQARASAYGDIIEKLEERSSQFGYRILRSDFGVNRGEYIQRGARIGKDEAGRAIALDWIDEIMDAHRISIECIKERRRSRRPG